MNTQKKWTSRDIIDKDILELLGVENLDPVKKEELYKKMMETIQTRVMARVNDLLSDEDAARIKLYLETDDQEKFDRFMSERNIDIKQLYSEEALLYKLEITELITNQEA